MQTQGISLVSAHAGNQRQVKNTKASDTTFDSFMDAHASRVSTDKTPNESNASKLSVSSGAKDNSAVVDKQPQDNQKIVLTKDDKVDDTQMVDMAAMLMQTMDLLQDIFQMPVDQIQDVMSQAGIQVQDLLFQSQDGTVSMVNTDAMQNLVMKMHGIDDSAAFLTNATLTSELTQLQNGVTDILSEGFQVAPEQFAEFSQNLMQDFGEKMNELVEQMTKVQPEPIKLDNESAGQAEQPEVSDVQNDSTETVSVVVEQTEAGQNDADSNSENSSDSNLLSQTSSSEMISTETSASNAENAAALFTDKLTEAFTKTEATQNAPQQVSMTQIVEQVVRQVKIRVLPETTSMELQLNPASLGRVNLEVSSTNGVATANLTVENQVAKEALESQLITLKETFAEQGIKVDSVEVAVSDFSLKKENEQEQQEQQKQSNRRFRADAGMSEEGDEMDTVLTSSDRRRDDSVVDYTA